MGGQQLIGPQFVGIAEFFGLLAGTILHPSNRVVRQLPRLAGPRQFSQPCLQTELEALLNAQHHRAATGVKALRNGLVTLSGERIQQHRRADGAPFFLGSGSADGFEFAELRLGELQGVALPRERHTPLKHIRP
jgi:hypothetical protein